MCAVQRITEEEGGPRVVIGSVQEGQGETVDAVVDRLVERGVPRGGVERKVHVSCGGPCRRSGGSGFEDRRSRARMAHIGWRQKGDRPIDLDRERQGVQGGEGTRQGSRRCRVTR